LNGRNIHHHNAVVLVKDINHSVAIVVAATSPATLTPILTPTPVALLPHAPTQHNVQ
jgi:hypothetical protein